jgi:hypothetical protein
VARIPRTVSVGAPILCGLILAVIAIVQTAGSDRAAPSAAVGASDSSSASATASVGPPTAQASKSPSASPAAHGTTLHYISNVGDDRKTVGGLGFNLFDMGPNKSAIDALANGQYALVWLGNLDNTNCTPGYSLSEFKAAVDRLAGDRKVFGYFISDEPHPTRCPHVVEHLRQRADYIHAKDPKQKVFIVILDSSRECGTDAGCEYRPMRPELSHVDYIGIDSFPCVIDRGCDIDKIDEHVNRAVISGIPRSALVPVIQVFGQACNPPTNRHYAMPSEGELRAILARFHSLVPNPAFDYAYGWGSKGASCPALDRADGTDGLPDLQSIVKEHNRRQ